MLPFSGFDRQIVFHPEVFEREFIDITSSNASQHFEPRSYKPLDVVPPDFLILLDLFHAKILDADVLIDRFLPRTLGCHARIRKNFFINEFCVVLTHRVSMRVIEPPKCSLLHKCRFDLLPYFRQWIAIRSVDEIGPYSTVKSGSMLGEP